MNKKNKDAFRPTQMNLRPKDWPIVITLSRRISLAIAVICFLFAGYGTGVRAQSNPQQQPTAPISPQLQDALRNAGASVSFLVMMKEQLNAYDVLLREGVQNESRVVRAETLYRVLTAHAQADQQDVRTLLDEKGVSYQPFYIINMIEVVGDAALIEELTEHPDVDRIELNPAINQRLSVNEPAASFLEERINRWLTLIHAPTQASLALPYGLEDTNATDVWTLGFRGQGITVASQDTGVQWDHAALKGSYRGWDEATDSAEHVYNWFDAWGTSSRPSSCINDAQVPCDDNGHGSHTVGTMTGDATSDGRTVIGMAPEANWIGCRNMLFGVGNPSSYTACFEFFLAPYPQGGDKFTDGRPELGPDIINNSWGCPPSEGCDITSLREVVETVRAAGQFVIASAGNEGNRCSTVANPIAMHDATFSIGAHSSSGTIASFSSRGPVSIDGSGRPKPDLTAPGVSVESAYANNGYRTLQGTSMASPHVAGAAALLWSAVPTLTGNIDLSEQVLIKSAVPTSANQCGEGSLGIAPNYTYGFGRMDILAAVELAQNPASASVQVLNCDQSPLAGAEVQFVDQYTGFSYKALSDDTGNASIPMLYSTSITGTAFSEIYTATVEAGDATFAPITTTIQSGNQVMLTMQALTCTQPATVKVLLGGTQAWGTGTLALVNRQTGYRYTMVISANQTAALPAPSIEFANVLAGEYWIIASSEAIQTSEEPVVVEAANVTTVQLSLSPTDQDHSVEPPDGTVIYVPLIQ